MWPPYHSPYHSLIQLKCTGPANVARCCSSPEFFTESYAFAKKERLFVSCERGNILVGALACVLVDVPNGALALLQLRLDKLLNEPFIV